MSITTARTYFGVLCLALLTSCSQGSTLQPVSPPQPAPPSLSNSAPVVSAGDDQTVDTEDTVFLTATVSDTGGDSLTTKWEQISGVPVTIDGDTSLNAEVIVPASDFESVFIFQFTATDSNGASASDRVVIHALPRFRECTPGPVPDLLREPPYSLDDFYQQYCDAEGIPVIGSEKVVPEAIIAAHQRVIHMSKKRPEVLESMIGFYTRASILAQSEVTTDIPELADLYDAFPGKDWNKFRGLGATKARPAVMGSEEDLLCLPTDISLGEDIFVHEFAHTIDRLGIRPADSAFALRLQDAFDAATALGLWDNTYAGTNKEEYWAEGVQDWFNVNLEHDPPNGIHNFVNTRDELFIYDRALHDLIEEYSPEDFQPACPL